MTLSEIFSAYTPGSTGFCIAVETHCGFNISRDETKRIAARAATADEFEAVWQNDDSWTDEKNQ